MLGELENAKFHHIILLRSGSVAHSSSLSEMGKADPVAATCLAQSLGIEFHDCGLRDLALLGGSVRAWLNPTLASYFFQSIMVISIFLFRSTRGTFCNSSKGDSQNPCDVSRFASVGGFAGLRLCLNGSAIVIVARSIGPKTNLGGPHIGLTCVDFDFVLFLAPLASPGTVSPASYPDLPSRRLSFSLILNF
jgi:hypothetical protein